MTVSCNLMGRCGNQMFQIAATLAYALRNKAYCHIPSHTLNDKVWPTYFEHLSDPDFEAPVAWTVYREPSHGYSPIEAKDGALLLSGFFQSYKYFSEYSRHIKDLFHPDWRSIPNTCAVHIRRGDYLLYPTKHPVITEEYLDRAIRCMEGNYKAALYIFFTDDVEWAKKYLSNKKITYLISENKTPLEDIRLMANCAHQIISNSSFSWWGAYLNRNPDKIVLTPSEDNWFGIDNKRLDVSDLLPPGWERIKY